MPAIPVSQNFGVITGLPQVSQSVAGQTVPLGGFGFSFQPRLSGTGNSACMYKILSLFTYYFKPFILGGPTQSTHQEIIGLHCQFKH